MLMTKHVFIHFPEAEGTFQVCSDPVPNCVTRSSELNNLHLILYGILIEMVCLLVVIRSFSFVFGGQFLSALILHSTLWRVFHYLWFFEGSPQCQVPGSEGRQSSRWNGRRQIPDPAWESSARGECDPGPAAEAGGAGHTCCIPRVSHFYVFVTLLWVTQGFETHPVFSVHMMDNVTL